VKAMTSIYLSHEQFSNCI